MDLPLTVEELRRTAAHLTTLPPYPWRAVELTDLELHGPAAWDPDLQPSAAAHARDEQERARRAVWRGVVDADSTPLVGAPLGGGSPQPVVDPVWRWIAGAPQATADLLDTVRQLWPRPTRTTADPDAASAPEPAAPTPALIDRAARAAYEAVPSPTRWSELPARVQDEWRARAAATLAVGR